MNEVVAIVGIFKSGSSILAQIVEALGVYMGRYDDYHIEDKTIAHYEKEEDTEWLIEYLEEMQKKHELIGFKHNLLYEFVPIIKDKMDFKFLYIFRDPVAVMVNNHMALYRWYKKSEKTDYKGTIIEFLKTQIKAIEKSKNADSLFVSYEKLLLFPRRTIKEIANFLKIDVTEDKVTEIAKLVIPEWEQNEDLLEAKMKQIKEGR